MHRSIGNGVDSDIKKRVQSLSSEPVTVHNWEKLEWSGTQIKDQESQVT